MNTIETQSILLVDDRPENLVALEAVLEQPGVRLFKATSGNEALELLLKHEFALVLMDVQMPGMDGFETAALMRSVERSRHIPIIFVTAISTEDTHVFRGYEAGAVDYIFKPVNPVILTAKVNVFLELNRQCRELEDKTRTLEKIIAKQEEYKRVIEEKNRALKELAIRDGLTGIYNHRHFQDLLEREIALAKRYRKDISCLMMDLDHFKEVNDSHGHQFGDFVLREFVRLIQKELRSTDILARYGGEEFVLVLPNIDLEGARSVAEKIRKIIETNLFSDEGQSRWVTVTIGIYHAKPGDSLSGQQLLRYADKALYQAKEMGRNRVMVYSPDPTIAIWESLDE
ncbi:MAG: diguanylate cyclase [Thermodesulfobacteriota bacterium]